MTHIPPKKREDLPDLEPMWEMVEEAMGFVPESMLTMAHWPELQAAFGGLGGTILAGGMLDPGLKQLIALVSSRAAGCNYCQAHTSHSAEKRGVSAEKIAAAFEFETSPLFDEAERAALRVSWHGSLVPNAVTAEDMAALKSHYSDREIVEIVAVISLFGFLNRWNDSMATTLEEKPRAFAADHLAAQGWQVGKHAG